jgi:hypothetical protein
MTIEEYRTLKAEHDYLEDMRYVNEQSRTDLPEPDSQG